MKLITKESAAWLLLAAYVERTAEVCAPYLCWFTDEAGYPEVFDIHHAFSRRVATETLDAMTRAIRETMQQGGDVSCAAFGGYYNEHGLYCQGVDITTDEARELRVLACLFFAAAAAAEGR